MKLFILIFCLVSSFSLFADDAMNADHPCMGDVQKFCATAHKGHGEVMKCLKEHDKEISPACQIKMADASEKMKEKLKGIITNCKKDAQKFCKDVPRGHGGKVKCLEENKEKLSASCKSSLP